MDKCLTSRQGPAIAGALLGIVASLLVYMGNPGNMGFCVACFVRDIAGAIGLHRAAIVQYIRPEIPGFILGSFAAANCFGEFRSRGGSSPIIRFLLGICAMIGALIFLGCSWRSFLRLAGGDWNAVAGILGLAVGVRIGIAFLWNGFSLGAARPNPRSAGWMLPVLSVGLLLLLVLKLLFSQEGAIFFSAKGPGSMHAPLFISLLAGCFVGWLAQRSRFCTVGALRDFLMLKDAHLMKGLLAFTVSAFVVNLFLGQFHPGFSGQPVAHSDQLWNFLGMTLSGMAFTLAGGCPGRQLIMAGEGDGDAAIFTMGMLVGAAISHNFSIASSPAGVTQYGILATLLGIAFCSWVGFSCRSKMTV